MKKDRQRWTKLDKFRPIYTKVYTKLDQLLPCIVTPWNVHDLRVLAIVEADDGLPSNEVGHVVKHLTVHLNLL
jgi:hypothetical protein